MNKKEWLKIMLRVLIYALGLIAAALGITSMTSCKAYHYTDGNGRAVIITTATDTTVINHRGVFHLGGD